MDRLAVAARLRAARSNIHRRLDRRWRVHPGPVSSVIDIPDQMPLRNAIVVSKAGRNRWLVFDCPCQTGHRVVLNLDPTTRPVWTIKRVDPLSLTPSVDQRTTGRRCHYIIRRGRVTWV